MFWTSTYCESASGKAGQEGVYSSVGKDRI